MGDSLIEKDIKAKLAEIEVAEKITILYACESGSRAWGFESKNSDYDIRFFYRRPLDDCLVITKTRDVMEQKIGDYDIVGFDIKKTLVLIGKSNLSTLEWLLSDVVYMNRYYSDKSFKHVLLELAYTDYFNPINAIWHHVSIAQSSLIDINTGKDTVKKALYLLRSLMSAQHVFETNQYPDSIRIDYLIEYFYHHGNKFWKSLSYFTDGLVELKKINPENTKLDSEWKEYILTFEDKIFEIKNDILNRKRSTTFNYMGRYNRLNEVYRNTIKWEV